MTNKLTNHLNLIHGGDYNPDQWLDRPDILEKDIELMKKAHINSATLGVFSWSAYERKEGEYHFEWLLEVMDNLYKNGIYTVLATPTGARPAWLDNKYPEIRRCDEMGVREYHRERHNHCATSEVYREKVKEMNTHLANAVKGHPGLIMWHMSNEYSHYCYCDKCKSKFQKFLKKKYKTIDALNHEYWSGFWSKTFNDFEEVEPPYKNGECSSLIGLNLDWKRFNTLNQVDFMKEEIKTVKAITPEIPCTTNLMPFFEAYDYKYFAKELDYISWDSYPMFDNDYESLWDTMMDNAYSHSYMQSLIKGKPFMLMESAPSLVNWHSYNKLKRPKMHALSSLQAIANGSDSVQYFQFRKGRGAWEQFHGAVVDHLGTDDTRVFKDVTELGKTLEKLGCVAGSTIKSEVAIIMDWENHWSLQNTQAFQKLDKKDIQTWINAYKMLKSFGLNVDIVSSEQDLSSYKVVFAPMMFMLLPNTAQNIKNYVQNGGTIISTYITGYVNENQLAWLNGFPGDGLTEVFGIIDEEIDSLYPSDSNHIVYKDEIIEVKDYCELLRIKGASVLATYTEDFYAGYPALTCNTYGNGKAYYIATRTDFMNLKSFFTTVFEETNVCIKALPEGVEYTCRTNDTECFEFYLNETHKQVVVSDVSGLNIINDKNVDGELVLEPLDVAVIKK